MDLDILLPTLWRIITKQRCAVNISTHDKQIEVLLLKRRKIKQFKSSDINKLSAELMEYACTL